MTLKDADVQSAATPGGRQFHYGIREHAMSASWSARPTTVGFGPLGSTFFVFSDYAAARVRLASLSDGGRASSSTPTTR